MVEKFKIRLQHLSDIVKFANIALDKVSEQNFADYQVFQNLSTANDKSLKYTEAQKAYHDWCLRNAFRDAVELLSGFLQECFLMCSLLSARKDSLITAEDYDEIVSKKNKIFSQIPIPEKG